MVEEALCDVGKCGTKEKSWWERQMGLTDNDKKKKGAAEGRPHSKSDPSHSQSKTPLSNDPNTAWHYEQLDQPRARGCRPSSQKKSALLQQQQHCHRPGIGRSSSQRLLRDTSSIMTSPKTTPTGMAKQQQQQSQSSSPRSEKIKNSIAAADPTYDDDDDDDEDEGYYTLEPKGCASTATAPEGYFDVLSSPPRRSVADSSITVTTTMTMTTTSKAQEQQEHRERQQRQEKLLLLPPVPVGVRRVSKIDDSDLSPPQAPSRVTALRPTLEEHRSISFVL